MSDPTDLLCDPDDPGEGPPEAGPERIDDLVGLPAVGRTYLVPCVALRGWRWPVLPPAHDDPVYFPHAPRHYHVDARFSTLEEARALVDHRGHGWTPELLFRVAPHWILRATAADRTELRPRECLRQMPVFPTSHTNPYGHAVPYGELRRLERDFAAVRIRPGCRRCPHRGIPLNGLPEVDGVTTCPAHGLAWNLATGGMVRRVTGGEP